MRVGSASAGLYGKLPWAADFVRIHHVHPASIALDGWLQASMQPLAQARVSWPSERVRFLLHVPSASSVLAGVLAASRDRAGRKFPVSIFSALPSAALATHFAALPRLVTPFLDQAEELLDQFATRDRETTQRAVEGLRTPRCDLLEAVRMEVESELASRPTRQLADKLFASAQPEPEPLARALSAFALLVESTKQRGAHAARQVAVLDCPIHAQQDVEAWLALLRGRLLPSLFWAARAEPPRLLLALGTVPATLPLWLAQPSARAARLVPLAAPPARDARLARLRDDDWDLSVAPFAARLAQLLEP